MEADAGKEYLPHELRVVEEHKDLKERRIKLNIFIHSEIFTNLDERKKSLMQKQAQLMYELEKVLEARIADF